MAMPLETAMPCNVKLICTPANLLRSSIAALRGARRLAYPFGMSRCSAPCALHSICSLRFSEVHSSRLFTLSETVIDKVQDGLHRIGLILAVGLDAYGRALRG